MNRVWELIGRKQSTIGSAAAILVSMVFTSRVLGLIRDRLLSARFTTEELGVYFAAFRLPNFIFELLVTGALTSAFIPVFTRYIAKGRQEEGWNVASILINVSTVLLALVSLPIFLWTDAFSQFFAPGFSSEQIALMTSFTRFMILFQVAPLLIGNFFTGILQSYNLFLIPAIAPVLYNVGIIAGILALTSTYGLFAPVIGIGIGATLFMAIQIPILLRLGYVHRLNFDLKNHGVREVGRLIGPRAFGLAVSQIDTTVDLMLSTLLGAKMVTVFNFAQHLQQLPVGLFGASIAQAALPTLTMASVNEDKTHFRQSIIRAIFQVLFFVLPISVFFIVLRIPIVRLVFGASRFDWESTVLTGMTLSAFSISLFAQSIVHVLARGFYALYDTKTPVVVSIVAIVLNTVLSVVFIQVLHLEVWSLGLSTSIASIVNAMFLFVYLDKRIGGLLTINLIFPTVKMTVASLVSGVAVYIPMKLFDVLVFDTTRVFGLFMLTVVAGSIGLAVYFTLSWLFDISEVHSFFALMRRVRRPNPIILQPATEVFNEETRDTIV